MQAPFAGHARANVVCLTLRELKKFEIFSGHTVTLAANAGNFICEETHVKRLHTQFTCVARSLPVNAGKPTCSYAASTSRGIYAISEYKARKTRVTSPAGCRLTYLHFVVEFTRDVTADCLQLHLFFTAIAVFFCLRLGSIFAWKLHVLLQTNSGNFDC